jgi:membrane-associated protease RseP (regulator of RpoE activity)
MQRLKNSICFFNPWFSLFKKKKGETEYGIGWIPLGGYVKISGMIDESMDKEAMKNRLSPMNSEQASMATINNYAWWCYGECDTRYHHLHIYIMGMG